MIPIEIHQGNDLTLPDADINVIIDVVRAFTVTHYAFSREAKEIMLVATTQEAFDLKQTYPHALLAGEVGGLPIEGFDLDNSPVTIASAELQGKILIQKTTNGVKATLHSLNAPIVLVTGFSNADATIEYIQRLCLETSMEHINLVASHPSSDEDMACAEYIRSRLLSSDMRVEQVQQRICESEAVKKFFDPEIPAFDPEDINYCLKPLSPEFVMRVMTHKTPTIQKVVL